VEKQHAAFIVQWIFMLWVVASFIILIILPSGEKGSSHPFYNSGNLGPQEAE